MSNVIQLPTAAGATPEEWAHFDVLLALTEDLLPVVSNPKAVISPQSSIRDLGKLPSVYNAQRQAVGFSSWTQHRTSGADIAKWSRERDYGICLQTRRVRAIDVDVTDPVAAQRIHDFIHEHVGQLPRRVRVNSSKFLLAFEVPGELAKRKFKCEHGIVEMLATGQQFIAVGTHPSGVRYAWDGGLPDEFPAMSMDLLDALWSALVEAFAIEDAGTSTASVKTQKLADVVALDPVAQFLLNTSRVKKAERDGRMHIVCPFEDEHTSDSGDTSTTYWPAHTGGYVNGHFHCLHAHCEHRNDQEFLDAISYASTDLATEFSAIADVVGGSSGDQPVSLGAVEAAKPAARFTFQPAHQFAAGKPPAWIVKGVLPQAVLAVLFGESGSGKSFAALDLAVDIALGSPWRGKAVRKGRVAYIAAEGAGGFRTRLRAIAQHRGLQLADIPLVVLAEAPNFMEKTDALDVAKAIHAAGGADLVIVDTFAQVMPGANENAGEDVGRALAHCKGIHRATGALVMLVHHSGKDASRGARGWSGLRAACDVELEVLRNDDARSLTVTKLKDGDDGMEFAFRLESVVVGLDEEGEEITSCVVSHGEGTVRRGGRDRTARGAVEQIVVRVANELVGLADGFIEHAALKAGVVGQLNHEEGKRDQRSARADRAIESLVGSGMLKRERDGLRFAEGVV